MTPRGIRNNNPGNIERGIDWQGLAEPHEMTPAQLEETRFAVFRSPLYGIRAMSKVLTAYRTRHGLTTVRGIISRWAPAADNNDVSAYASAVASAMQVSPDAELDTADPDVRAALIKAMIRHENGQQPYPDSLIQAALALAVGGASSATPAVPVPIPPAAEPAGGASSSPPVTPVEPAPAPPPGVEEIAGTFRAVLAAVGGMLVQKGMAAPEEIDQVQGAIDVLMSSEVQGALMILATAIWSIWRKISRRNRRAG